MDGGTMLEYELVRRKGKRTVTIRITPDGLIKVSASYSCTSSFIEDIIRKKYPWIRKVREKMASEAPPWTGEKWNDGMSFFFMGQSVTLRVKRKNTGRPEVFHGTEDDSLVVTVTDDAGQEQVGRVLMSFFRRVALQSYESEVSSILARTGLEHKMVKVKITSSRSRWGSCSNRGTICFSLRSLALPGHLREYLVLHEVAHLVHMNHGTGFKTFLTTYMPDWKVREKEMQGWQVASRTYT